MLDGIKQDLKEFGIAFDTPGRASAKSFMKEERLRSL